MPQILTRPTTPPVSPTSKTPRSSPSPSRKRIKSALPASPRTDAVNVPLVRSLTRRDSTESIRENERFSPIPFKKPISPPMSPPPLSLPPMVGSIPVVSESSIYAGRVVI